jgi:hypothetical protein
MLAGTITGLYALMLMLLDAMMRGCTVTSANSAVPCVFIDAHCGVRLYLMPVFVLCVNWYGS